MGEVFISIIFMGLGVWLASAIIYGLALYEFNVFGWGSKMMRHKYPDITDKVVGYGAPKIDGLWYGIDTKEDKVFLVNGPVIQSETVCYYHYSNKKSPLAAIADACATVGNGYIRDNRYARERLDFQREINYIVKNTVIVPGNGWVDDDKTM